MKKEHTRATVWLHADTMPNKPTFVAGFAWHATAKQFADDANKAFTTFGASTLRYKVREELGEHTVLDNQPKRSYQWDAAEILPHFAPKLKEGWADGCYTLEEVAEKLRELFPGYFVYMGGNHVALHKREGRHTDASGKDINPRLLCIVNKPEFRIP